MLKTLKFTDFYLSSLASVKAISLRSKFAHSLHKLIDTVNTCVTLTFKPNIADWTSRHTDNSDIFHSVFKTLRIIWMTEEAIGSFYRLAGDRVWRTVLILTALAGKACAKRLTSWKLCIIVPELNWRWRNWRFQVIQFLFCRFSIFFFSSYYWKKKENSEQKAME